MKFFKWLGLQLFAGEGAGDGGGEGAATGEGAADPGRQKLLELGVPANKLRKGRAYTPAGASQPAKKQTAPAPEQGQQAAAAANPTEEASPAAAPRMKWEEIVADPEYNKEIQRTVQSRLRSAKDAEEKLGKLTPALELIARKYGQDPANMDYDALVKAVTDDNSHYEDKALEMGVSVDTAKRIVQQEQETARTQRQQEDALRQQKFQQHITKLEQQAAELKKTFPNFDLRQELQNPAFARMTSPNVGVSVEDAYYAVHRRELQTAAMQVAAQRAAEKVTNAVQSGINRPKESGISGQAPSVTSFDYRSMSPQDREALKKRIRSGEKIYPGQM